MNAKQAKELYNSIRAAMEIVEAWSMWEIGSSFDWKSSLKNFVGKRSLKLVML